MKFSTYLTEIAGVSLWPLISLLLFVLFFVGVTLWVYSFSKEEIERFENLPNDQS